MGEKQNASAENRLRAAAAELVPGEAAKARMIERIRAGKHSRKRLMVRVPAAALAACLLICLLWLGGVHGLFGEKLVVYAATEEYGWQRLKEGERILLKKEPYNICWEGPDFSENGRCTHYPYRCSFRVEVSERYLYDKQMAEIGDDCVMWQGNTIEWLVAPERPGNADKVRKDSIRLWIVSDNVIKHRRERIGAYELELTKEDGSCYVELKRVWEK